MSLVRALLAYGVVLVAACSASANDPSQDGGNSGAGATGGSGTAGATSGGSGGGTTCSDFSQFERACWDDSWCDIAFHQLDCCGSRTAMGIFHTAVASFDAAEQTCAASYPACECAAQATTTDTGQATSDESTIAVQCRSGLCTTYVP
jgi:hypothetical protein